MTSQKAQNFFLGLLHQCDLAVLLQLVEVVWQYFDRNFPKNLRESLKKRVRLLLLHDIALTPPPMPQNTWSQERVRSEGP